MERLVVPQISFTVMLLTQFILVLVVVVVAVIKVVVMVVVALKFEQPILSM